MKIFLDANILFSASDPDSATMALLQTAAGSCELVTSPHAWEEARRNLAQKRPGNLKGLHELRRRVKVSHAFKSVPDTSLPDEDIPIIAGASGSGCTHLWTSDKKHFGRYYGKRIAGVIIISSIILSDKLGR